jgi:uncharacterized protein (DUF885 family)
MYTNRTATRRLISIIILLALCITLLSGCGRFPSIRDMLGSLFGNSSRNGMVSEGALGAEEFDMLMDELFAEYATSDSLTMNYNVADPERLGLRRPNPPTFGDAMTPESITQNARENQELSERLRDFSYSQLRTDQQIVYDILIRNIEISQIMSSNEDFAYYRGVFFPIAGMHVQMPVILAEFRFYTEQDIGIYLEMLEDIRRYFDENIAFERERARRGFFMTETNVDKVIAQSESFLENTEDNLLIAVFNDKIDGFAGLSDAQREQYKNRNRELVLGSVLPAYEALLSAMRELRGTGVNPGGLAALPGGREYAEAFLRFRTGSDMSPRQVETLIANWMERISRSLSEIFARNPSLAESFFSGTLGYIPADTPENYLYMLEAAISRDFPAKRPVEYTVREVHVSLQDFMSPAFYLIPALDNYDDNVIYINPRSEAESLDLFTLLAHEGYPGHLYQVVYYLQQSPHPIRTAFSHVGYVEGWATYAEMSAYFLAGLHEDEAALMMYSRLFDLLFLSRIDLGVNALGWDIDRVASYLRQFGIEDPEVAEDIFQTVIGYPLHYMPYTLGYLELVSLREEAESALRSDFDLLEFHRFILDFGPAPFPLINEHMQGWIRAQPSGAQRPAA